MKIENPFTLNDWDARDPGRVHLDIDLYSLSINRTSEGLIIDVWERDFEGSEPLATLAIADSDWEDES